MQLPHSIQLNVDDLAFERNYELLFSDISFALQKGELLQVKGANGSGKSTLLRILAGFIEPHAGAVLWKNQSIFQERASYQEQLRYVGHQNGVKHILTVYENVQLSSALCSKRLEKQQIQTVIERVGLSHLMYNQAQHLSAGQLRRLGLARLLLNPASLWILDEPTTALDTDGQQLLADIFNEHLDQGGMVIVATHQSLLLTRDVKTILLGEQDG
jgi:heme exporter protein A